MRKILSYGALVAENLILKKEKNKLKIISDWLLEETIIQTKIIGQLNLLLKSRSSTYAQSYIKPNCCEQGHFRCEINHKRFNLVRTRVTVAQDDAVVIYPTKVLTNREEHLGGSSDRKSSCSRRDYGNEALKFKKLSKHIDSLQSKYGLPSPHRDTIMVASLDEIVIPTVNVHSSRNSVSHSSVRPPKLTRGVPLVMFDPGRRFTPKKVAKHRSSVIGNPEKKNVNLTADESEGNSQTDLDSSSTDGYASGSDTSTTPLPLDGPPQTGLIDSAPYEATYTSQDNTAPELAGSADSASQESAAELSHATDHYYYDDDFKGMQYHDEAQAYEHEALLAYMADAYHSICDTADVDAYHDEVCNGQVIMDGAIDHGPPDAYLDDPYSGYDGNDFDPTFYPDSAHGPNEVCDDVPDFGYEDVDGAYWDESEEDFD